MERLPDDDWFDKLMLTIANSARPLTEEWFRLMGWLLIIAALGYGVHKTQDVALMGLLIISMAALFLRLMFGYLAIWHDQHMEIITQWKNAPGLFFRFTVWSAGAIIICTVAGLLLELAWRLSGELALAIH